MDLPIVTGSDLAHQGVSGQARRRVARHWRSASRRGTLPHVVCDTSCRLIEQTMQTVLETNNLVLLSLAEAVLRDAGIPPVLLDAHMSAMDGSIGAIPRRLCVADPHGERARALIEALDNEWR